SLIHDQSLINIFRAAVGAAGSYSSSEHLQNRPGALKCCKNSSRLSKKESGILRTGANTHARPMQAEDSIQWNKLLQAIAKGVVIPIVGRDLLRIQVEGREQLLYDYLAAK